MRTIHVDVAAASASAASGRGGLSGIPDSGARRVRRRGRSRTGIIIGTVWLLLAAAFEAGALAQDAAPSGEVDLRWRGEIFVAAPDLVVTRASAVQRGARAVQVAVTVHNRGGPAARGTKLEVVSPWARRPLIRDVKALRTDESQDITVALKVPRDTGAGDYRVIVSVDPDQDIAEPDERNNTQVVPFTFEPPPVQRPDLIADARAEQRGDRSVQVAVTVRNQGGAPASDTTVEIVSPWARQGDARHVRALEPEDSQEVALALVVPDSAAEGAYRVRIAVDPEQRIVESDEANNTQLVPFTISIPFGPPQARRPDLVVEVRAAPRSDRRAVDLAVTVRNQGRAAAPATAVVAQSSWGTWTRGEVRALGARGVQEVDLALPVSADVAGGDHRVTATVDPDQRIRESDERNTREVSVTLPPVQAPPDLAIVQVSAEQSRDRPVVQVAVTVRNEGREVAQATDVEAGAPWGARARTELRSLGAGDSQEVALELPLPAGAAGEPDVTVTVDPDQRVADANPDNNRRVVRAAAPPPPPELPLIPVLVALAAGVLLLGAGRMVRRIRRARAAPRVEARLVDRGLADQRAQLSVANGDALELSLVVHPGRARSELLLAEPGTATEGIEPWPAPLTH